MAKGRRGRPASSKSVRRLSPSRRPARADHGTPELQKKKAELTRGADPALSTHAIDRAFAQLGWFEEEHRRAAWRYTCLKWAIWGKGFPKLGGYGELIHEHLDSNMTSVLDDERAEELAVELKEAELALQDAGGTAPWEVRELCADNDIRLPNLKRGLDALVKHFGFTQ